MPIAQYHANFELYKDTSFIIARQTIYPILKAEIAMRILMELLFSYLSSALGKAGTRYPGLLFHL